MRTLEEEQKEVKEEEEVVVDWGGEGGEEDDVNYTVDDWQIEVWDASSEGNYLWHGEWPSNAQKWEKKRRKIRKNISEEFDIFKVEA